MAIHGRSGAVFSEINVTPLTDVFLVLLVIMILIAPLANQTVLKVSEAGCHDGQSKTPLTITVDADNQIKISNRTISSDFLSIVSALKAEQDKAGMQDIPVLLQANPNAQQKYVVAVMDAAAQRNIKALSLVTTK